MAPTLLQLVFRGYSTPLAPGVLLIRASAPNAMFGAGGEAFLESRLSLVGDTAFHLAGTIGFGDLTALRFRTVGLGLIADCAGTRLRSGAAVCELDSGTGLLEDATGRITSNFLVSDSGEVTDHQVGLLFVNASRAAGARACTRSPVSA